MHTVHSEELSGFQTLQKGFVLLREKIYASHMWSGNQNGMFLLKVAVSQDFLAFFVYETKSPGNPDKQAKLILLNDSFARRYSQNK